MKAIVKSIGIFINKIENFIFLKYDDNSQLNIDNVDFVVIKSENPIKKFLKKFFRLLIIFFFLPLIGIFYLFSLKQFSKVFKQVIVILYIILFAVFIYTLFNMNEKIVSNLEVIRELDYKNKIKNFN